MWAKSLEVYRDACLVGSDSQEVSLSGVDGMTTMVLLVGRMGLKSVQVRAGTGMKIVDGTLQRSPPSGPAATGKFGRGAAPSTLGVGGGSSEGAAAAGDGGGGEAATATTPEFAAARPGLYLMAWVALVEASRFRADVNGDVAPAFVQGLAAVYKAGVEDGAELSAGQEGEEERMGELFEMLDGLFPPRVPAPGSGRSSAAAQDAAARRPVYLPKVCSVLPDSFVLFCCVVLWGVVWSCVVFSCKVFRCLVCCIVLCCVCAGLCCAVCCVVFTLTAPMFLAIDCQPVR